MIIEVIACFITIILFLMWYISPSARMKEYGEKIPGPKPYPIVGTALEIHVAGQRSLEDFRQATQTYGKVFRLWTGPMLVVVTSDLRDVQMILSSNTLIKKGYSYTLFERWVGTGLVTSSDDVWHKRRKAITPTFHFKILDDFLPIFNKCADILVDCLSTKTGQTFNISPYLSNAALDIISESAMGIKLGVQKNPKSEYVASLDKLNQSIGARLNYPWLCLEPFFTLSGRKKLEDSFLQCIHSLPKEVLEEKRKALELKSDKEMEPDVNEFGMKKRIPFLERLLHIRKTEGVPFETEKAILDEVTTFMFAGHDTVSTTLSFTIWELGKNPEVQENVYREVSEVISEHPELRMEDLNELKYLERVIKETLRIYPPAAIIGRYIHEDTTFPSGHFVPEGTELYIPLYLVHWDPEYYPEPFKFDPDRFLEDHGNPYAYVPFSAGSRNCIGQKFAMLDLKVILSKIVYNYRIKSEGEMLLSREITLRSKNGINVTLTKR